MDYLASTYDYVSVSSIGQSYEGNDMRVSQIIITRAGHVTVFSSCFVNG